MDIKPKILLALGLILACCCLNDQAHGQVRSLLHWKRDLEYRLSLYSNQQIIINNIISSSIYSPRESIRGPAIVSSDGNVRFSDLIIPNGSLVLDSHVARPTVRILVNKTQGYVDAKMNELDQIRSQLDNIKRQVEGGGRQFIYKGLPNVPTPQINSTTITGRRIFKQFVYGRLIDANRVNLTRINFTNVEQVISEAYMENQQFGVVDSENRLFFEGRKTLWKTSFARELRSGCCDRLKPLHTNRMMIRSRRQDIFAPIMFLLNDPLNGEPIAIRHLLTDRLYNRMLIPGSFSGRPDDNGLLPTQAENLIQLHNLINIGIFNQPEILKTIIFKDLLLADVAQLSNSVKDNRLVIGIGLSPNQAAPLHFFDLSHENYLLKFAGPLPSKNMSTISSQRQIIAGTLIINGATHFVANLDAAIVNRVHNFTQFIKEQIVRIDKPSIIRGSIQFNALPAMFSPISPQSRQPQNVLIMHVAKGLQVGLVNGMRLPQDIVLLPPNPAARQFWDPIRVRGPRQFMNLTFNDFLEVKKSVNNIQMPAEVIPLHLNDFMGSIGYSNLVFIDGISAHHITTHDGRFDDIVLRDAYGDAQSLIMRSVFNLQPDGSHLIGAPLRVMNLRLFGQHPNEGLLNGFRPQNIIELAKGPTDTVYGKRTFLAPVEATDCIFSDMNHISNWTNHLIRIDRPNTVQTIHTKLAFVQQPRTQTDISGAYLEPQLLYNMMSSVNIDKFQVQFYPNKKPSQYLSNLNLSPEFHILHQALVRSVANHTEGRYRVLDQVRLSNPNGRINGIDPNDIVTLDSPTRFADKFVMVGKVEVAGTLRANRITSNYPIDAMDLVQFDKYRIPITGFRGPIRLNNLVLGSDNRASYVQCRLLNGIPFSDFANSIMSLTMPQNVDSSLVFGGPVNFEGLVRTESSLNSIKHFKQFANNLKTAKYSFENGLQCNSVIIKV